MIVLFTDDPKKLWMRFLGFKFLKIFILIPGDGGIDGTKILSQLLLIASSILKPSGKLIIGINTRHLKDEIVIKKIQALKHWKWKKFYNEKDAQPNGPYAQVYILEL